MKMNEKSDEEAIGIKMVKLNFWARKFGSQC